MTFLVLLWTLTPPPDVVLAEKAVERAVARCGLSVPESATVQILADTGAYSWLLSRVLRQRYPYTPKPSQTPDYRIRGVVGHLSLSYRPLGRWMHTRVERRAQALVYLELRGTLMDVVQSCRGEGEVVDTVPAAALDQLRSERISPPLPPNRSGVWEFLLTTVTLVILVYTLYSYGGI